MINSPFQLADHTYCLPVSALTPEDIGKLNLKAMENGEKLMWQDEALAFEPPSPSDQETKSNLSALSPAHSIETVDSGFDGIESFDFLADFLGRDSNDQDFDFDFPPDLLKDSQTKSETVTRQPEEEPPRKPATADKKPVFIKDEFCDMEERNKKNAVAARENRLKKKKYVEGLEVEVHELRKDNSVLKSNHGRLEKTVQSLQEEVLYYKNVLENQSTLSVLINRIATTPGISFTTSFSSGTEESGETSEPKMSIGSSSSETGDNQGAVGGSTEVDASHRYQTRGSRKRPAESMTADKYGKRKAKGSGGICLHVSQDKVSLEMCQHCSIKATGTGGSKK